MPSGGFAAGLEKASAHALLYAPEVPDEAVISAHVCPTGASRVDWDRVHNSVSNTPECGLLFLALMSAFGASSFGQKVDLIKCQWEIAGTDLAGAKRIVESAIARLGPSSPVDEKWDIVRDFLDIDSTLPLLVTDALKHRLSWYRWGGLELLDAWGAPDLVPDLVANRFWDRSELVRRRALRMPFV
ncbi:MAG TPA: hypothetical protein VGE74_22245 [Gemmata sp.]